MKKVKPVTNIFVGNLESSVTEGQLRTIFGTYGAVETVTIVKDRDTGQGRGFAFVEMANAQEAEKAIQAVNGLLLNQRPLRVNEARPKPEDSRKNHAGRGRDHRRHRF